MNRRKFCATALTGITASVGGCLGASESVGDLLREDNEDEVDLEFSITPNGELLVQSNEQATKAIISQNQQEILSVDRERGRGFYIPLAHCGNNEADTTPSPGQIDIVLQRRSTTKGYGSWTYNEEIETTGFDIASVRSYNPIGYPQEATPIFDIEHTEKGGTCIQAIEIDNPSTTIDTEDGGETPMMKTGKFEAGDKEILHNTQQDGENEFVVTSNRTTHIAFDGLFTINAENEQSGVPIETDEITQTFDVTIHTGNGREYTNSIEVVMTNGFSNPPAENFDWTHRFTTVRFLDSS